MTIDLSQLVPAQRLLFAIPLAPLQGNRFQPTGFPGLGAATFQTANGRCLLVESAQSMANRLEQTCWDEAAQNLKPELSGLSHVRVMRGIGSSAVERQRTDNREFFADSITEAHRINSPYIMFASYDDSDLFDVIGQNLNAFEVGPPPSRAAIATFLLRWDIGSLLHGTFLSAKKGKDKTLAGGRIRIPRALSAFIEAERVDTAASGGVKNDHVNPSGDTKAGFGNVPFARDEFTAEQITLYVNLDLAQIRGYGLGADVERLLVLLALYKLRALVGGSLRLRTACDFRVTAATITATSPEGFILPSLADLTADLQAAIGRCGELMTVTEVSYNDELKKGKGDDVGGTDDTETPEDDTADMGE